MEDERGDEIDFENERSKAKIIVHYFGLGCKVKIFENSPLARG